MAKMVQSNLLVSVSKLVKNSEDSAQILDAEKIAQLEAIVSEIVDDDTVLIEVEEVEE